MKGDVHQASKLPENFSILDTSDWEVAPVGGVAGGSGVGAGSLFFGFRSPLLKQYLKFAFVGGGVAAGLVGGWTDPTVVEFDCSRADWRPMAAAISEPFSASNLCNAHGRVGVISIGTPGRIGWGYTRLVLTAIYSGPRRRGYLFDRFDFGGWGLGTGGLGLGVMWGEWVFLGLPEAFEINANWTKAVCES
jgi:hypothetical protein